ncbi:hypothetical protein B0H11DRAFT_36053 [Mycena galericulata]|nr:hypothetical protein B0H11DRAFT_36053 [Mycena galericulata]
MTALQEEEVNGRVFAATKRPCFCCDSVRSEFFNHQMSGNHNTVFPWAPPCGLPLTTLKKVELALERKLKSAAKARRLVDATGSGSDASSLVNDAEQVPRRRREWRYDLLG